jgi:hypothetical protein
MFEGLFRFFGGARPTQTPAPDPDEPQERSLKESSRVEDLGYRRLLGGSWKRGVDDTLRNVESGKLLRSLKVWVDLWRENPIAKKGIGNLKAFVCSEGFQARSTCSDQEKRKIIQASINTHMNLNNWPMKTPERVETLLVEGEWNYFVTAPHPHTGHVRICRIEPESISDITCHKMDSETLDTATLAGALMEERLDDQGNVSEVEHKTLKIVRRSFQNHRLYGNLLHLGLNKLSGQRRGLGMLHVVADYLDALDEVTVSEVDRARLMKAFVWHIVMHGASPDAVEKRRQQEQENGPPAPGTTVISNETEEMRAIAPVLNLQECIAFCNYLMSICFGALWMPQHWFSQGGDVNKATAGEMGTPVYAHIRELKQLIMEFLMLELEIALFQLYNLGKFPPEIQPKDLTIEVSSRDPERTSYVAIGTMLSELGAALAAGQNAGWIEPADASRAYRQAATQLGLGEFPEPPQLDQKANFDPLGTAQEIVQEALRKNSASSSSEGLITLTNEEQLQCMV